MGYKNADALIESQQILKIREKVLGPEDPATLSSRNSFAKSLCDLGRLSEAIPQWRELLKAAEKDIRARRRATPLRPWGISVIIWRRQGEYSEAEALTRRTFNGLERTFGQTHATTLNYRVNLVLILAVQDKDVEAEAEAREMVKVTHKSLGSERQQLARDLLGAVLDKRGKHKEAEVQIREAVRRKRQKEKGADADRDSEQSRHSGEKSLVSRQTC